MSINFKVLVELIGGFGVFIFGVKFLSDGLQLLLKDRLRKSFTNPPKKLINGVFRGAGISIVTQSSVSMSTMVSGFVNNNLLSVAQAVAIALGGTLGIAVMAQIMSINLNVMLYVLLGSGGLVMLYSRKDRLKHFALTVFALGLIYLGIVLMSMAFTNNELGNELNNIIVIIESSRLFGLIIGTVITILLSGALILIGIMMAMAMAGILSIELAVPILLGINIGGGILFLVKSIGISKTVKKSAIISLVTNVVVAMVCLLFVDQLINVVTTDGFSVRVERQIANLYMVYSIISIIIILPFINKIASIGGEIAEDNNQNNNKKWKESRFIDKRILETPSIALGQVEREIVAMYRDVRENIVLAIEAFTEVDMAKINQVYKNENRVNILEEEIDAFLVELNKSGISEKEQEYIATMYSIVNDIERVGDYAENIADLAKEKHSKNVTMSEEARIELNMMVNYVINVVDTSLGLIVTKEQSKINQVKILEDKIDNIEKELRDTHIKRLNKGVCSALAGTIFLDIINNLERIGDHANGIAILIEKVEK